MVVNDKNFLTNRYVYNTEDVHIASTAALPVSFACLVSPRWSSVNVLARWFQAIAPKVMSSDPCKAVNGYRMLVSCFTCTLI